MILKRYGKTWLDFQKDGLAKPGTVIQLSSGKLRLLGDLNTFGSLGRACGGWQKECLTECHNCGAECDGSYTHEGCQAHSLNQEQVIRAYATEERKVRDGWIFAWSFMAGGGMVAFPGLIWELLA